MFDRIRDFWLTILGTVNVLLLLSPNYKSCELCSWSVGVGKLDKDGYCPTCSDLINKFGFLEWMRAERGSVIQVQG
ncbi:hypothetical protein GTO10_02560 [Candidatus Saccharibacteria bacterium]|nr:hypothetical protein [Candidatus Saccharibacteria bacterium]